jgi:hypothetical protein
MIDVKIQTNTYDMHGKLDHLVGIVYIQHDDTVQVETVQNLVSKSFVLSIKEIPKEASILNFN